MSGTRVHRFVGVLIAGSLFVSSTGAAAVAQAPTGGCVLPAVDAPPAAATPPPAPIPVPPVEPAGGGLAFDPLLLGLGALAIGALAYFLLRNDNNDNEANSPT